MSIRSKKTKEELEEWLGATVSRVIEALVDSELGVREGTVMTSNEVPYRRLDCDGRALAYLRARPKKKAVRIDVTGLWKTPRRSKLRVPNAGGSATLLVRTDAEARLAIRFLSTTVKKTREARERTPTPPRSERSVSEPKPDRPR